MELGHRGKECPELFTVLDALDAFLQLPEYGVNLPLPFLGDNSRYQVITVGWQWLID